MTANHRRRRPRTDRRRRARRDVSVAIVGAGLGGIATAVKLERAGLRRFTVFEQSDGPGGTWWDNTYPGCEVDVHSHLYSYSFMANDWVRTHATQPEIQRYVEDTIDRFGIRDRIRFGACVEEVAWDDAAHRYRVRLASGEELVYDMVVTAVGILNQPRFPDWPGLDEFAGPKFHTARWEHEHDLAGKRIAFVGTGSTGAQAVPELAKVAGHLYVFQRQPGWLLPKEERLFTEAERRRYRRSRLVRAAYRFGQFRQMGKLIAVLRSDTSEHRQWKQRALEYLETAVDDPETRSHLTPDYPFACKRLLLSSTYYPAFNQPNVTLVPHAVTRVTRDGIVATDGVERKIDVLVMGTGFRAQSFLVSLRVKGAGGRDLHDAWAGEPRALAGSMVPGFPNFFMVYGPNTNGGGSIVYQLEKGAEVAVRAAKRLRRTGALSVDTRPEALRLYVRWLDRAVPRRLEVMESGLCTNYNHVSNGRNVVQWPFSHIAFHLTTLILPRLAGRVARRRARLPVPRPARARAARVPR